MKNNRFFHGLARRLLLLAWILPLLAGFAAPASAFAAEKAAGAVYTLSNAADGNQVLIYNRAGNGRLAFAGAIDTGGKGSGAALGAQGALVLSENKRWLFAVNAGSNDVSAFKIMNDGLQLVDRVPSGGSMPISLDVAGNLLYVLNAGEAGNISGFRVRPDGRLMALAGSTQPLSNDGAGAAPGPAQVEFSPDGKTLAVTEKATNQIDIYAVVGGLAQPPVVHPSAGMTPFGFEFSQRGFLIVSEAFGGQDGASAMSSYALNGTGLTTVSPSVATTQTAACWVAISKNDRYAYTTNFGSGTISSYRIERDGALTLLAAAAGDTGAGSHPIDLDFSANGRFLYALSSGTNTISVFLLRPDGSLNRLGEVAVAAGAAGLAAR